MQALDVGNIHGHRHRIRFLQLHCYFAQLILHSTHSANNNWSAQARFRSWFADEKVLGLGTMQCRGLSDEKVLGRKD